MNVEQYAKATVPLYPLITDSISDCASSVFNANAVSTFHKEGTSCKTELVNLSYVRICAA